MYKQVIVIRDELKLPKGKMCGQACHASVRAVLRTLFRRPWKLLRWFGAGEKKVVVKIDALHELDMLERYARSRGVVTSGLIRDAGRTVLEPGTVTCFALGPDSDERLDPLTGGLKLM